MRPLRRCRCDTPCDAAPGHVFGLLRQRRDDRNLGRAHPVVTGPPRRLEGDDRPLPAVHRRRRARLDAADRPHPRPPLERLRDTRHNADLLSDAAAAAAGDERVHARCDPVRVRSEQRCDGRLHERARRRRRARAVEADHVFAARRLEPRRLRVRGPGRGRHGGGNRPATGEPARRRGALAGGPVDHPPPGERIGPVRGRKLDSRCLRAR